MHDDPADTCWISIRSAASGDAAARSSFTLGYQRLIREFFAARWSTSLLRSDVEDAVQDVFVECLKPGGALERADEARGEFRGMLYGVARNVARRFEKRAAGRADLRPEDSRWLQEVVADEAGQATLFDRNWAQEMVLRAKRLHVRRAEAEGDEGRRRIELLERRFGADEAIRDIASAWGVEARQVHNAYRRARTDFYRCLRDTIADFAPAGADLDAECKGLLRLLQ